MGLPFVVLNMVSAVLFKDMGVSDAQIAFWTSLIMWPWTIKFLWSPFLELFRSQKFFVVATQLVSGLLFGFAALALHLPAFFAVTVALFAVVAFSGATHDIAADGLYMSVLSSADQAKYIGWQGAFYNLAKLVATGGLVWFAGWLFERFAGGGAAETAAYRSAWTVVLCILGALMLLAGMWHLRILPQGHVAAQGSHSLREGLTELRNVVRDFFAKKGIPIKERIVRCASLYDYLTTPLGDAALMFPPPPNTLLKNEGKGTVMLDIETEEPFSLNMYAIYRKDCKPELVKRYLDLVEREFTSSEDIARPD